MLGRKGHNKKSSQKGIYLRRNKLSWCECRASQWPQPRTAGQCLSWQQEESQPSVTFVPSLSSGATAPLGWSRPLLCPSRSRSVIFHYCSWSNVSILTTFKKVCSPWHHWHLKNLSPLIPVWDLQEGIKPWESCGKKGTVKPLVCVTHCSPSSLAFFSILHPGHHTVFKVLKDPQHPSKAQKMQWHKRFGDAFRDQDINQHKMGSPLQRERGDGGCPQEKMWIEECLLVRQIQWHKLHGFCAGKVLGGFICFGWRVFKASKGLGKFWVAPVTKCLPVLYWGVCWV